MLLNFWVISGLTVANDSCLAIPSLFEYIQDAVLYVYTYYRQDLLLSVWTSEGDCSFKSNENKILCNFINFHLRNFHLRYIRKLLMVKYVNPKVAYFLHIPGLVAYKLVAYKKNLLCAALRYVY